ncbi:uncharacterized protein ColSpa_08294 [Colletotrichum spaethianum]|uniref:Uncharacterized protein n=1 Tax=Colletotrichum spaethianum TaxID=700344 RepID=A0AA37P9G4_9PEZI|nr:uncharacterized protein ColSpa_08294 [Colletotrichum spaethianum]GKT48113.1 hypothetical protein ColSpa_08294 [Colletotrichum spaethianum]
MKATAIFYVLIASIAGVNAAAIKESQNALKTVTKSRLAATVTAHAVAALGAPIPTLDSAVTMVHAERNLVGA